MTSSDPFASAYSAAPGYEPSPSAPTYAPPVLTADQSPYGAHQADTDDNKPSTTDVAKDQAASVAGGAADATKQVAGVAKDQAAAVAGSAADATKHVAGVAKEQVGQVTAEAGAQVRQLVGQAQSELSEQAKVQQQRAATGLHAVGDQLKAMAQGSDQPGMATDLAHQAADKAHQFAGWLEDREPGGVLEEVRSFARQRPGVFLLAALGAGLVAGRLARGLSAGAGDVGPGSPSAATSASAPRVTARPAAVSARPSPAALVEGEDSSLYGTGAVPDWTGKTAEQWGDHR